MFVERKEKEQQVIAQNGVLERLCFASFSSSLFTLILIHYFDFDNE
jgi:hypothetical protein